MKAIHATILVLVCTASAARAGDLAIRIDDVKTNQGQVRVALYDSADGFLKHGVRVAAVPAAAGGTTVVFKDLAPGRYSAALYHDANGDGKMDRNAIGLPVEDYAFSNNALGLMGPPSFEQAMFAVPQAGTTVTVSLR